MATLTIDQNRWEVAQVGDTRLTLLVQVDGVAATMTSPTLDVYDGATLLGSPSVTATSGVLSATVTESMITVETGTTVTLSWTFTVSGEVRRWQVNVPVVDILDHPGCTQAMLYEVAPELSTCFPTGQTTWIPQIQAAWRKLKVDLEVEQRTLGNSPNKLVIGHLHLAGTMVAIARVLRTVQGRATVWTDAGEYWDSEYQQTLSKLRLVQKTRDSEAFPKGSTVPVVDARGGVSLRQRDPYQQGRM
jgi:hypothetical protein